MNCQYCNTPLPDGTMRCPGCGSPVTPVPPQGQVPGQVPPQGQYAPPPQGQYAPPPQYGQAPGQVPPQGQVKAKKRIVYQLLALFFGQLGIHNFYAGRIAIAVIQLVITIVGNIIAIAVLDASGGVGPVLIWALIEIFAVKKDGRGIPMK